MHQTCVYDVRLQEVRRLVIAIWQNVAYEEWLHLILGDTFFKKFNLGAEHTIYNPKLNPDVANEVATAAFRFGHTLIPDVMPVENANFTKRADLELPDVSTSNYKIR